MLDENYYEPVLAPAFHNELTVSPSGLVYNASLKMAHVDTQETGLIVSRNEQKPLLNEFSNNSFTNRRHLSVQPPVSTNFTSSMGGKYSSLMQDLSSQKLNNNRLAPL